MNTVISHTPQNLDSVLTCNNVSPTCNYYSIQTNISSLAHYHEYLSYMYVRTIIGK